MCPEKDKLTIEQDVSDGCCVLVPPGRGTSSAIQGINSCSSTPATHPSTTPEQRQSRVQRRPARRRRRCGGPCLLDGKTR